jgi:hypothetical protein
MYPSEAGDARSAVANLLRDALFRCPTLQAAASMTKAGATAWLLALYLSNHSHAADTSNAGTDTSMFSKSIL